MTIAANPSVVGVLQKQVSNTRFVEGLTITSSNITNKTIKSITNKVLFDPLKPFNTLAKHIINNILKKVVTSTMSKGVTKILIRRSHIGVLTVVRRRIA